MANHVVLAGTRHDIARLLRAVLAGEVAEAEHGHHPPLLLLPAEFTEAGMEAGEASVPSVTLSAREPPAGFSLDQGDVDV